MLLVAKWGQEGGTAPGGKAEPALVALCPRGQGGGLDPWVLESEGVEASLNLTLVSSAPLRPCSLQLPGAAAQGWLQRLPVRGPRTPASPAPLQLLVLGPGPPRTGPLPATAGPAPRTPAASRPPGP